ncbi:HlyD family secretion protein [Haliscomenobacter hydrossis]|uniref:Secretion protein HlyD family protein n=1 Tax=Haliscomenobacter hydrossis (strain ATCC 27775 / DSM 1100 / LMG 10767 / O) TaxID=760192 RepID=F4KQG9_HALH1|nr:biotin/lipoyl-binding protein [Haliscomenobacter hydrossis]AEE49958.1 secretion protein HlyD family protein [Haliscomenobacter hydrossis DSM 1100]
MKATQLIFLAATFSLWSCGADKTTEETQSEPLTSTEVPLDSTMNVKEVVGIARIEPSGKIISINAETAGFVKEVLFAENQAVKKGEVLVVLESAIETAQLRQTQSRIKTQQAAIDAAVANLESLRVKLANAQNTYNRNLKLQQGNAATQQSVDDSRFNVDDLQKQLAAQAANIEQQRARLEELRTDIGLSQTQLGKKSLRAPLSGIFLSCDVKPGNYINSEKVLGDFAKDGPYLAVGEVDELYALRVKNGNKAYIRAQGENKVLTRGTVVFTGSYLKQKSLFSDRADNLEDRRVREVHVRLDDNSKVLIGSRVECVIELDQQ